MKKLEIVNIYKHNIVYKNVKKVNIKNLVLTMSICLSIMFSFCYMYFVNSDIMNSVKVFNPISELYRDVETASFVSAGSINFIAPIKTERYIINENSIDFIVDESIIISAPESGIICKIGNENNGIKYIKIQHSQNIFSIIKNVDVVGININENVKQGKILATAKQGDTVNFSIEIDGKKVNNLYFNKSFIKWETK